MVLVEYVNKHPSDAKATKGEHCRTKRGAVNLGQHLHSEGFKRSHKVGSRTPKLHFELFSTKMESLRKWPLATARACWDTRVAHMHMMPVGAMCVVRLSRHVWVAHTDWTQLCSCAEPRHTTTH